jgi:RNAse (barnase) inhibitor barstar
MAKAVYEIDGCDFSNLEEFYDVISRVLIPGAWWGRNLDAFNDILRGGFGTPDDGFVLHWKNSSVSRQRLGTVFFKLTEIIHGHCASGDEHEDGVELILE